jgi:orotate phosphoribosyltransferase
LVAEIKPLFEKMQALIDIVKKKGIVVDDITLSSGEKSEYYYDLKNVLLDPDAIDIIVNCYCYWKK